MFLIGTSSSLQTKPTTMKTNGLFYYMSNNSAASITDGTSHTMVMSESLIGDGSTGVAGAAYNLTSLRDAKLHRTLTAVTVAWIKDAWVPGKTYHDLESAFTVSTWDGLRCNSWLIGMPNCTTFGAFLPPNLTPNSNIPSSKWMNYGFYAARSYHTGGVNVLMADGSARFVSDTIDYARWRAAATIDSGEAQNGL